MTEHRKKTTTTDSSAKSKRARAQTASSSVADPQQEQQRQQQSADPEQRIRERAYELYLARNGAPGDPVQDWLIAEQQCREEPADRASQGQRRQTSERQPREERAGPPG